MGLMNRGAAREYGERLAARVARAVARPMIFQTGTIKSYDPATSLVVVTTYFGTQPQDLGPMQYFHRWCGNGYGDEIGLETGMHVALLCVDREGHDWVAFNATFDADHKTLGVQPSERYIKDKRGSYVKWMVDGSLRLFSAGIAYVSGATKVWLGAETGIDDTNDAVITKHYLDQWWSEQLPQLKTDLTTWATESLSAGGGAPGPTTLNSVATSGSSKVKAAQ